MEAHTCTFRQTHSAPSAWQPSNQVADSQHLVHFVPEFNSSDFSAKVRSAPVSRIVSVQQRSEGRSSGCFPPVRATWGLSCPAGSRPPAGRLLQARLLLIRRLSTELKAAPDCRASSPPQKQSLYLVTAPPAGAEASLSLPAASYQPDNIR